MNDAIGMRRRLRVELRRLRVTAQLTQRDVAESLEWSHSKIIRIENGGVGISVTDLRALLDRYGITDTSAIDEYAHLARYSRRLPFSEFRDVISPESIRYFGYEAASAVIRQVEPLVVPGLLQTEEYSEAVLSVEPTNQGDVARIVESRRQRQEILLPPNPVHLSCIIDEAVLRRSVGGAAAMKRQLQALADWNSQPNIDVRVVGFASGAHFGIRGPFVLLEFADPSDATMLYLENPRGGAIFEDDPDRVAKFLEAFLDLEDRTANSRPLEEYVARAISEIDEP